MLIWLLQLLGSKSFVIVSFLRNTLPNLDDFLVEIKKLWPYNPEWEVYPFQGNKFLVKIMPFHRLSTLVAQGRVNCSLGRFLVCQWSAMEGNFTENRERKILLKLKNLPLFCWNNDSISKILKGFGDVMLDDLIEIFCQGNEAVVLILCLFPCFIPHKINAYIEEYAYEIKEEILGEVI